MDSLVATYASSDEDDEIRVQLPASEVQLHEKSGRLEATAEGEGSGGTMGPKSTSKLGNSFKILPPPKYSVVDSPPQLEFRSLALPKPRSETNEPEEISKPKPVFSLLPQPKSSSAASKKVVQFKLPTIPYSAAADDESDDDGDKGENGKQEKKHTVATHSIGAFLSSMPAPKQAATLGTASSAMGSSRRYVIETEKSVRSEGNIGTERADEGASSDADFINDHSNTVSYDDSALPQFDYFGVHSQSLDLGNGGYDGDAGDGDVVYSEGDTGIDPNVRSYGAADYSYGNAESTTEFATYGDGYGSFTSSYGNSWADDQTALPESSGFIETAVQVLGKRGRKDVAPSEIIEVKQDELMKNRPREDQAKLTGIAFGPAYQPASTKGKPSKLQKRKHQIGSLYFDMKQKESELSERRARGLMTKAQTQAKYGW